MPSFEPSPAGGGPHAYEEEEACRFILLVKDTMEGCLKQGMNKEQMFRVIREKGLSPWIAFAVFKELRQQNHEFFKGYYCRIDLKEQREKLNRLIQAYRQAGSKAAAGARLRETAPPPDAMEADAPVIVEWSNQETQLPWLDLHLLASPSDGGDQFALASSLPHLGMRTAAGQKLHGNQQPVSNGELQWPAWLQEAASTMTSQQLQNQPMEWPQQEERLPAGQQLNDGRDQPMAYGGVQGQVWPQQLHDHELPVAGGGFQGAPWQRRSVHFPSGPQLHGHEPLEGNAGVRGVPWQEQVVQLPFGQQLHVHEPPAANAGVQGLPWRQHAVHLPSEQQQYNHQQLVANDGVQEAAWQQLHYQEHLTPTGGFHGAPRASAACLNNDAAMGSWSLSNGGLGWEQGQQDEPLQQWWPSASADPSTSSTPGDHLLGSQKYAGFFV